MIRMLAFALVWSLAGAAHAHSFWLEPATHEAEFGAPITVEFKVGDAGDVDDWGLYWERIAAFQLFTDERITDQQSAVRITAVGEKGTAQITPREQGTHIIAFASNPSFSELEAERFNRYLEHEGLAAITADREAKGTTGEAGTELYARRAKTLIKVGDGGGDDIVTRAIGQTLEIVPLNNPFTLAEGEPLRVRILWRGAPLEGATLNAAQLDSSGEANSHLTNEMG
ncbi:MAG: DUF4198 domain-containing protein, partial [Pseudomonadota bacterium]